MVALKASVGPQDWAQISFRSETLSICFYSESDFLIIIIIIIIDFIFLGDNIYFTDIVHPTIFNF